jgi:glycosyltransferase involved in cell wall biosynthesis
VHILIIPSSHFVVEKSKTSGVFQLDQSLALAKNGHTVGIISVGYITLRYALRRYPYVSREEIGNLIIFRNYFRSFVLERFSNPEKRMKKIIESFKDLYSDYENKYGRPDVVHAHDFIYGGVIAEHLKNDKNIPYIITVHSSAFARNLIPKSHINLIYRVAVSAGCLTCVSKSFKKVLENQTKLPVSILHNVVNSEFFNKPLAIKSQGNNEGFTFISVGSLDENKNHELLLRAFSKLSRTYKLNLKIVGDGPLRNKLEALSKLLEIDKFVKFYGEKPRNEVCNLMMDSNCLVHTSNYETFGVVLIEGLACGLPLISTCSGGPEDIINNENGLLVGIDDELGLQKAMLKIKETYHSYDRQKIRNDVLNDFGENTFVKRAVDFYKYAIAKIQ